MPKNLRRQAKAIFVWYCTEWENLQIIHDEKNVLTDDELVTVRDFLRMSNESFMYTK